MSDKFPERIVLGEGWPVPLTGGSGCDPSYRGYVSIGLDARRRYRERIKLVDQKTYELMADDDCPKYRLVLERAEVMRVEG